MLASVAIPVSSFSIATLPLYGFILKWGVSVVFIANVLRWASRVRAILHAYTTGDNSKRVTRVSQFTTVKHEREREIERLGKRQALYTHLYFPRGFRSCKWPSCAVICRVQDTLSYFRRCAFLRVYVASWLA